MGLCCPEDPVGFRASGLQLRKRALEAIPDLCSGTASRVYVRNPYQYVRIRQNPMGFVLEAVSNHPTLLVTHITSGPAMMTPVLHQRALARREMVEFGCSPLAVVLSSAKQRQRQQQRSDRLLCLCCLNCNMVVSSICNRYLSTEYPSTPREKTRASICIDLKSAFRTISNRPNTEDPRQPLT